MTIKLNPTRRSILLVGSCVSFFSFLIPPWASSPTYIFLGHTFILNQNIANAVIDIRRLFVYQCLIFAGTLVAIQLAWLGGIIDKWLE
jgi:hypothetical protein